MENNKDYTFLDLQNKYKGTLVPDWLLFGILAYSRGLIDKPVEEVINILGLKGKINFINTPTNEETSKEENK